MRKLSKSEKVTFLKTAISKGLDEAKKTLPALVVRYIHKDGKVYDNNGNDVTGKEIQESRYPTITINRKIINHEV